MRIFRSTVVLSTLITWFIFINNINAPDILLVEHSHKLCIANIIDTLHGKWKLRTLDTH